MTHPLTALGLLCAVVPTTALLSPADEAIEPGARTMLFDGKSFDGLVRHVRGGGDVGDDLDRSKPTACWPAPASRPGYIRTDKAYKNYKLHVEYRWPGKTGNNGVLVHMTGEDKVWPKSLECQGMFHNQGDFFEIGGVEFNEHKAGGHRVRGRRVVKYGEHNEKEARRVERLRGLVRRRHGAALCQRQADERSHRLRHHRGQDLPPERGRADRVPQHLRRTGRRQALAGRAEGEDDPLQRQGSSTAGSASVPTTTRATTRSGPSTRSGRSATA